MPLVVQGAHNLLDWRWLAWLIEMRVWLIEVRALANRREGLANRSEGLEGRTGLGAVDKSEELGSQAGPGLKKL